MMPKTPALALVSLLLSLGFGFHASHGTEGVTDKPRITLLPLGTGKGATAVYDGEPSSSFVIKVDDECRLLVDTGLGTSHLAIRACGSVPRNIFISHNHSDHAGELPVLLIVEQTAKRKLRIISGPEVNERLVTHRIAELYSTGLKAPEIADWVVAPEGREVKVDDDLSLVAYKGKHSEVSYGFVLSFYQKLAAAPTLVLDARESGTEEHAGFDEIHAFEGGVKSRVFVTHYGKRSEAPTQSLRLAPGEAISL
jgi:ribonuclease BN (tRNA processing enzyme)